ncbi:MAG: 1-deoxy-D-xylulose-5-phosphate synthase [Ruminococcaceae bacterium]|nr:1-deoxy-D-xylulose-5-phosphate synthase [Oscillospiraceae bacterium]
MPEHDGLWTKIPDSATLQNMKKAELNELCDVLRQIMIETVSQNGGHLASNLGVVELTVALHRAFRFPKDQVVWDVGHQCYTHKLLTGRAEVFHTLRQEGGITGFPSPAESETDCFITGHSSTSVSAANGLAKAKKITGDDGYVIAVMGDGALTGGLAYEGLSNAGRSHDRLIVILNDNRMSINQNVGFVARHLAKLRIRRRYLRFKQVFGKAINHIPLVGAALYRFVSGQKDQFKRRLYRSSTMFEEMGFHYLGPIDGHNIASLDEALRSAKNLERPVLLHVLTTKGKGCDYAIKNPAIYHGVGKFDITTGQTAAPSTSFSTVFGQQLQKFAAEDDRICAVTAAMTDGTGLKDFAAAYPSRFFDVGIAEEHGVTFCSGMAQGGLRPVFAVYSTFLQRCSDQLLNDTALLNSHVVLAVDRAGIVPDDGETHQGIFDVPLLNAVPQMTVFSPATFEELELQLKQALYDVKGPVAVRYPKGVPLTSAAEFAPTERAYTYLRADGAKTLLITYGRISANVLEAAKYLTKNGRPTSVLKLNCIKPIDPKCVELALSHYHVHFFEESAPVGGVGERFGNLLAHNEFARHYTVHAIKENPGVCTVASGLHKAGLDTEGILQAVGGDVL